MLNGLLYAYLATMIPTKERSVYVPAIAKHWVLGKKKLANVRAT